MRSGEPDGYLRFAVYGGGCDRPAGRCGRVQYEPGGVLRLREWRVDRRRPPSARYLPATRSGHAELRRRVAQNRNNIAIFA